MFLEKFGCQATFRNMYCPNQIRTITNYKEDNVWWFSLFLLIPAILYQKELLTSGVTKRFRGISMP